MSRGRRRPLRDKPVILYLITNDISSLFLRGQLAFLQEQGYRVELGTRLQSGDPSKFDDGVLLHDLPYVRDPSPVADLKALIATIRLVRRVRPDIVNASTPKAGLLGTLAAWLCRVPQRAYVVRGLRYETTSSRARRVFRSIEKLTMRMATDVVFQSRSLRAVAEHDGLLPAGRGVVLGNGGNGLDVERFANLPSRPAARASFGFTDDDFVVGFIGRFTADKGLEDLVRAFDLLHEQKPNARLLLIGQMDPRPDLDPAVVARLERDPLIRTQPWVQDPGRAYMAMDVLAFPSAREGLPNVVIEAQYCGVPVIAYRATGTVDAIVPGGSSKVLDRNSPEELARALGRSLPVRSSRDQAVVSAFDRSRVWRELAMLLAGTSAHRTASSQIVHSPEPLQGA